MRKIYIVKRSNGFIGIYVSDGDKRYLVSNYKNTDNVELLFNSVYI